MKGIIAISSFKKKPLLTDGKYLKYKGFKVDDTFLDYELLYLSFNEGEKPRFKEEKIENKVWII